MTNTVTVNGAMRLSASYKLGDNGTQAVTRPVKLVANAGGIIDYPGIGPMVWDFDTMSHKNKIQIDWAHGEEGIGYVNKFDVVGGKLELAGALTSKGADVANDMADGIPFEASIESHGGYLDEVLAGEVVTVNGRDQIGPYFVLRNWKLAAVAICKFGRDENTSAELLLAAAKKSETKQVLPIRLSKQSKRGQMDDKKLDSAETVDAVAEVAVEVEAVEQKEEKVEAVEATPEAKTDEVAVVEVAEVVEAKASVTAETATVPTLQAAAPAVDPRAEFKQFVASFGDKAADYYATGLSMEAATGEYLSALKAENAELKTRLAASETARGAEPVIFSDESKDKPRGLAAAIKVK